MHDRSRPPSERKGAQDDDRNEGIILVTVVRKLDVIGSHVYPLLPRPRKCMIGCGNKTDRRESYAKSKMRLFNDHISGTAYSFCKESD